MRQTPRPMEVTTVTKKYRILEYRDGGYKAIPYGSDFPTEELAAEHLENEYTYGEYLIVPVYDVDTKYYD